MESGRELLKEIAPSVTRAAVLRDPTFVAGIGQFAVIQAVAPSVGIEVSPIDLQEPNQIERAIAAFAQSPNGGLILTASGIGAVNVNLIIAAAGRHKLPAVYNQQAFVAAGGLISYGPNYPDQFPRAPGYVDRILRGEKPADLPVQAPNKYHRFCRNLDCLSCAKRPLSHSSTACLWAGAPDGEVVALKVWSLLLDGGFPL